MSLFKVNCQRLVFQLLLIWIHRRHIVRCPTSSWLFRGSWIADYADRELSTVLFEKLCPGGETTPFDAEFDALYEASLKEVSNQKRIEIYRKMNQLIMQEAAVVPLYYDQVVRFVQNNISGLPSNAMNLLELKTVSKHHLNWKSFQLESDRKDWLCEFRNLIMIIQGWTICSQF